MIDIMLMLLIFFMLTTNFVTQTAHDIDLPESRSTTVLKSKTINIYITHANRVFLNDTEVTLDALTAALRPVLDADPEKVVVLKADSATPLGYTVRVIDIVKAAGGKRLTITTRKATRLM